MVHRAVKHFILKGKSSRVRNHLIVSVCLKRGGGGSAVNQGVYMQTKGQIPPSRDMIYESTCTVASVTCTSTTICCCFAALEAEVLLVFCSSSRCQPQEGCSLRLALAASLLANLFTQHCGVILRTTIKVL